MVKRPGNRPTDLICIASPSRGGRSPGRRGPAWFASVAARLRRRRDPAYRRVPQWGMIRPRSESAQTRRTRPPLEGRSWSRCVSRRDVVPPGAGFGAAILNQLLEAGEIGFDAAPLEASCGPDSLDESLNLVAE